MNIKEAISKVIDKENLSEKSAESVMNVIMSGEAKPAQIAAYITALRMKGETIAEITGSARAMRSRVLKIAMPDELVDTCGTGGDSAGTINISTISSLVLAGADLKVAKHGNRSVSSRCGSADLLMELGVNIEMDPGKVMKCIQEANVGFMFAPIYHQSMKHAAGPRRDIGVRTIFNSLGPLTNPAGARIQVLGVYSEELTGKLVRVLQKLGSKNAFVLHGYDGLDEITLTTNTKVCELKDGQIYEYILNPEELGFSYCSKADLLGGDVKENARIAMEILEGKETGPKRDVVLLNAAPALVASGKAVNLQEGIKIAGDSIKKGMALGALKMLKVISNEIL